MVIKTNQNGYRLDPWLQFERKGKWVMMVRVRAWAEGKDTWLQFLLFLLRFLRSIFSPSDSLAFWQAPWRLRASIIYFLSDVFHFGAPFQSVFGRDKVNFTVSVTKWHFWYHFREKNIRKSQKNYGELQYLHILTLKVQSIGCKFKFKSNRRNNLRVFLSTQTWLILVPEIAKINQLDFVLKLD